MSLRDIRGFGMLLDSFIENSSIRIILGFVLILFSSIALWIMEDSESLYGLLSYTFIFIGIVIILWKLQEKSTL